MKVKFVQRFKGIFLDFKEISIALKTFLVMLIPVSLVILLFELFIQKETIIKLISNPTPIIDIPDFKIYLIYLTVSSAHIIICSVVLWYFKERLFSNISTNKSKVITKGLILLSLILLFIFFIVDSFDLNLALLSHERIYSVLTESDFFSPYFNLIPGSFFGSSSVFGFYVFSLIPFLLIFLGLMVIIFTCLNVGKDLSFVLGKIKNSLESEEMIIIETRIKSFHNYLYILSFVLMTSIIATMLFFQLPLTVISDTELAISFKNVSLGMGICWGVVFSLTMLAMCFFPYFILQGKINKYINNIEISENIEYKNWLQDLRNNYLIHNNVKSLVSITNPIIISVIPSLL